MVKSYYGVTVVTDDILTQAREVDYRYCLINFLNFMYLKGFEFSCILCKGKQFKMLKTDIGKHGQYVAYV